MLRKKDEKLIQFTMCDKETGLVLESGHRTYDFRFKRQRADLHYLLDLFIDNLENKKTASYIDFQLIEFPDQLELPF